MHVEAQSKQEISSLQEDVPKMPAVSKQPAIIYRPDIMAMPGSLFAPPPGPLPQHVQPLPQHMQPLPQHMQPIPQHMLPLPQHLQPQFIHVPPMPLQQPPHQYVDQSGNLVPAPTFPMQPPPLYPGVHNPYQAPVNQGYYVPPAMQPYPQPQVMGYPQPPPNIEVDNFHLDGVLEYGVLTTVHFRERGGNFRQLPEVLRRELQKTYGKYPYTDIKIITQGGEVHIHATPRNELDDYDEQGHGGGQNRLIGFGNVR